MAIEPQKRRRGRQGFPKGIDPELDGVRHEVGKYEYMIHELIIGRVGDESSSPLPKTPKGKRIA